MKQEILKKSWRKLWPEAMDGNVEVTESDTVGDELKDVSGSLLLANPMSQVNREETKERVAADFDEPVEEILTDKAVRLS